MKSSNTIPFPYAYFEKRMVKIEDAKISIMMKSVQYGMGWFGGVRGYMSDDMGTLYIFRLDDHIHRFLNSGKILGVSIQYSAEELKKIFIDLTKKNKPKTDVYYRPYAYTDGTDLTPNFARDPDFAFAMYMIPLGDYIPTDQGNSVCVSSWRRVSDNAIPSRAKISGAYVNSALAKQEAVKNGFVEAIELGENGEVTEGSAMNIFIVRNGMLITPSTNSDILEGITRRTIFEIAKDLGIQTKERSVDRSELYVADEVFFSGTGAQVAWISHIDHRRIGNGTMGTVTRQIRDVFFAAVRGKQKAYKKWLTPVKVA